MISPGAKRKSGLMQAVETQVAEVLQGLFGGKVGSQGSSSGDAVQGGSTLSPFSLVSGADSGVVQNLQSAFDLTVGDTLGGTHQQKRKQEDGWDWWHQGGGTL